MDFLALIVSSWPVLIEGLVIALQLTVVSVILAVVLGAPLAAMRMSKIVYLQWLARSYIAIVRGIPLVVMMFVIYFGIVQVLRVDAFTAAAVGLGVHTSAYVAEIFRSGFSAIPTGQTEAARSIGMSRTLTVRRVVGPQALRVVVPALVNQLIITFKDSAVAGFITVDELFLRAQRLSAANFQPLTFYIIVSLYYLAVIAIMTYISGRVERALSKGHA